MHRGRIVSSKAKCQELIIKGNGRCVWKKFPTLHEAQAWIIQSANKEEEIPNAPSASINAVTPRAQLMQLIAILEHHDPTQPLNVLVSGLDYCVNMFNYYRNPSSHTELWEKIWALTRGCNVCIKLVSK